jgi:hypothetical protein
MPKNTDSTNILISIVISLGRIDRNSSTTESRDMLLEQNASHHALIDIFFGEDNIVTALHVMMVCTQHQNKDAIAYTSISAFSYPVSICLCELGIVPFASKPDLIIPYDMMTKSQLACITEHIASIQKSMRYVCSTKMRTGIFVQYVDTNLYYLPRHLVLQATQSLLRLQGASANVQEKVMRRLIMAAGTLQTATPELR